MPAVGHRLCCAAPASRCAGVLEAFKAAQGAYYQQARAALQQAREGQQQLVEQQQQKGQQQQQKWQQEGQQQGQQQQQQQDGQQEWQQQQQQWYFKGAEAADQEPSQGHEATAADEQVVVART